MVEAKILVVVDMQNDFIDGVFGTPEAKAIVPKVVQKIKEYENECDRIAVTQDTHFSEYYNDTTEGSLPIHCIIGDEGWEINEEVQKAIEEYKDNVGEDSIDIYNKFTFGSSELALDMKKLCNEIILEDLSVGVLPQNHKVTIEIVGLCTDICVVSNALILKAFIPFANIIIDSSCCAGTTPENHQKALDIMKQNGIQII